MKQKEKVLIFLKLLYDAHKKEANVEVVKSEDGEIIGKYWTIEQSHLMSINDIANKFMSEKSIVLQRHDIEVVTKELLEKNYIEGTGIEYEDLYRITKDGINFIEISWVDKAVETLKVPTNIGIVLAFIITSIISYIIGTSKTKEIIREKTIHDTITKIKIDTFYITKVKHSYEPVKPKNYFGTTVANDSIKIHINR